MKDTELETYLAGLSGSERTAALGFHYSCEATSRLAFFAEYGTLDADVAYKTVNMSGDLADCKAQLHTALTGDAASLLCCKLSIPSTGRNPLAGSHAVALSIDKARQTIRYQDPWGTPTSGKVRETLEFCLPAHDKIIFDIPQQQDIYSCALITILNLVAFAHNRSPDVNIHHQLMDVRKRHAPFFLTFEESKITRAVLTAQDGVDRWGPEQIKSDSLGRKTKIRHLENFQRAAGILNALQKRDIDGPHLGPEKRFLIKLTL